MDSKKQTAGPEKAPALPVPAGSGAGAGESSSPQAPPQTPLLQDAAAAAPPADAPAAAAGGDDEEEEDEQVERFYALLANIRTMRGAYTAGGAADDICEASSGGGATRKRWRGSVDAPWRPAFMLEDFEEAASQTPPDGARCAKKMQIQEQADDGGQSAARPAVAPAPPQPPPPPPSAGVRLDSSGKNI